MAAYWKYFWADDAQFVHTKFWEHIKAKNISKTQWADTSEPDFKDTFPGCSSTLKYRNLNATVAVTGIPFVNEAHPTKHQMLYK